MSILRSPRGRPAAVCAVGAALLLTGCAGTPSPLPAASPTVEPAAAVSDPFEPRNLSTGQSGTDLASRASGPSYLDDEDAAVLWRLVARHAPPDSPYGRARALCVASVGVRAASQRTTPMACVPPYIWRFLPGRDHALPR